MSADRGWQCPVCQRVYSPTTQMCHYCPPKVSVQQNTQGPVAVCVIEVPDGEQLASTYPGYRYRQNLQMPPGKHPVYDQSALDAARAEGIEEAAKMIEEWQRVHEQGYTDSVSAIAAARDAALEDAAKACEAKRKFGPYAEWETAHNDAVSACVAAIRAMKGKA